MSMDQAAIFLASSVLVMLGFTVIVIGCVTINNIIHKYWKNLGWRIFPSHWDDPSPRFSEPHELNQINKDKK